MSAPDRPAPLTRSDDSTFRWDDTAAVPADKYAKLYQAAGALWISEFRTIQRPHRGYHLEVFSEGLTPSIIRDRLRSGELIVVAIVKNNTNIADIPARYPNRNDPAASKLALHKNFIFMVVESAGARSEYTTAEMIAGIYDSSYLRTAFPWGQDEASFLDVEGRPTITSNEDDGEATYYPQNIEARNLRDIGADRDSMEPVQVKLYLDGAELDDDIRGISEMCRVQRARYPTLSAVLDFHLVVISEAKVTPTALGLNTRAYEKAFGSGGIGSWGEKPGKPVIPIYGMGWSHRLKRLVDIDYNRPPAPAWISDQWLPYRFPFDVPFRYN